VGIEDLPGVNATLNGTAAVLILLGRRFARRHDVARHRACMLAAVGLSALFLASYVTYHVAKEGVVTRFPGTGAWRVIYFAILGTHTPLAATLLPLIAISVRHGLKGNVEKHRRIVRWTFPIWLYVSVTGVVIYLMLYRVEW
jgi:putative membrane protein